MIQESAYCHAPERDFNKSYIGYKTETSQHSLHPETPQEPDPQELVGCIALKHVVFEGSLRK